MRKLISCLLAVMMLFTMVSAIAEPMEPIERNNVVLKFLQETDTNTKDIAVQLQSGDKVADLVFRADGDTFHLVAREDGKQTGHLQLTPKALYVNADGAVTKLDYATVTTFMQDLIRDVDAAVNEAINNMPTPDPAAQAAMEQQLNEAAAKSAVIASMAATQAQADAATLFAANVNFANKFKPEYILDVKEEDGSVQIVLRSDAFAAALAEAIDDLMLDSALAELVDRQAALTGGKPFAEFQKEWITHREATLQAVRTIESTDTFNEDGHWTSHFQIGEETENAEKNEVLVCDSDIWVNDEDTEAEMVFTMGLKDEDPFVSYELAVNPYYLWQKQTAQDSVTEYRYDLSDGRVSGGIVKVAVAGEEEVNAEFGEDYLYMRGPKGGIFTSVRETWTGKIRYELFAETAEGQETSMTLDFYEGDDSLICELRTSESDESLMLKLSRIDKIDIDDLSDAENITEMTADMIKAEVESVLKTVLPAVPAAN